MAAEPTPALTLERLLAVTGGSAFDLSASGDAVFRLSEPADARAGAVTVIWNSKSLDQADELALLIVDDSLAAAAAGRPRIVVAEARLALVSLSRELRRHGPSEPGIHSTAVVHESASVAASAHVAAGAVIAAGASVGEQSVIGPGSTIGERSVIGRECRLDAGVHVLHDVYVGDRVILQSGCVLGAEGFGFVSSDQGATRISHLGTVNVADDVEIGANTSVDRGTLGATVIGARTKIDNLVQVAHNVQIGTDCLIAGQSAIGGSTVIGNRVTLAGNAALSDHIEIGDGATIGGLSGVSKDVPAGETWFGTPAMPYRAFARRQYLTGRLEQIWNFVRQARKK